VDAEYKKIPNEHLETPRPLDELDELDKLDEVDEDVLLLLEKEEDLDDDDDDLKEDIGVEHGRIRCTFFRNKLHRG